MLILSKKHTFKCHLTDNSPTL